MGNDQRSDGSSSSSKKNKNKSKNNSSNSGSNSNSNSNSNNSSDKPKQPQRGLGVAQLERIRLHSQMASCGFLPQQLNNNGFPIHFPNNTVFQHVNDDMRLQGGYQAGLLQSSSTTTPFVYGIPENLSSSSSSSYNYQQQHHHHHHHPNNLMMGVGEQMERTCNFRFGESHPSMTTRSWNPNNGSLVTVSPENNQYIQPQGLVTRHLLNHVEQNSRMDDLHEPSGSGSQNSESSAENYEELNLELKL